MVYISIQATLQMYWYGNSCNPPVSVYGTFWLIYVASYVCTNFARSKNWRVPVIYPLNHLHVRLWWAYVDVPSSEARFAIYVALCVKDAQISFPLWRQTVARTYAHMHATACQGIIYLLNHLHVRMSWAYWVYETSTVSLMSQIFDVMDLRHLLGYTLCNAYSVKLTP